MTSKASTKAPAEAKPARNFTPKETAEYLRVSAGTLSNWRVKGIGPRYIKLGGKVLYPLVEIDDFEQGQLRSNTAEKG